MKTMNDLQELKKEGFVTVDYANKRIIIATAYNGHKLYNGSKDGCYYINDNGNKTYINLAKRDTVAVVNNQIVENPLQILKTNL